MHSKPDDSIITLLTDSVENYVQAVVDVWYPVSQAVEIETILDVAAVNFAEHLMSL